MGVESLDGQAASAPSDRCRGGGLVLLLAQRVQRTCSAPRSPPEPHSLQLMQWGALLLSPFQCRYPDSQIPDAMPLGTQAWRGRGPRKEKGPGALQAICLWAL